MVECRTTYWPETIAQLRYAHQDTGRVVEPRVGLKQLHSCVMHIKIHAGLSNLVLSETKTTVCRSTGGRDQLGPILHALKTIVLGV